MRNYIWVRQFIGYEHLNKLEFFDDEYFIILKNNKPEFIAFPNCIINDFFKEYDYKIKIQSFREFSSKTISIQDDEVIQLIKDNKHYYNVIKFKRSLDCFIHENVLKKAKEWAYDRLWIKI